MYKYTLTEAYSEIYDHRKIEESFDNLRFVDHMLPEHIEEVIEELVWEFRDYGHTLEESFEMIDYALEDEVICESYDQLIADVLYEATITYGKGDIAGNQRRMAASIAAKKQAAEAEQQAKQRRDARRERIRSTARTVRNKLTGPISSVKQAVAGSAGGLAKSAKALGGKVVERGQALLKGLLRRGGKSLAKTGKRMMASGTKAAAAPATTRTARVAGRQVTVTTEPTAETGSKRRAVGKAIRNVGRSLKRMGKIKKAPTVTTSNSEPTPEPTPATPEPNALKIRYKITPRLKPRKGSLKTSSGDVIDIDGRKGAKINPQIQGSDPRVPSGPSRFKSPRRAGIMSRPETATRRAIVQRKPDVATKGTTGSDVKTPASRKALPASTSGQPAVQRQQISARKAAAAKRLADAAKGRKSRGVRFAAPGAVLSSQRAGTGVRERAAKFASQLEESDYYNLIDFILEDIMNIGYAQDEFEALDILESLTEDSVVDIALEYLND